MSATTTPIPPARFAAALPDLPLSSLHAKAAELRNSIAHLLDSNRQLQEFADEGDRDCMEAIRENEVVIARHEERIELLRREVVGRGFEWDSLEGGKEDEGMLNGDGGGDVEMGDGAGGNAGGGEVSRVVAAGSERMANGRAGRLGDEELARRLRERMEEVEEDEEDHGVHL